MRKLLYAATAVLLVSAGAAAAQGNPRFDRQGEQSERANNNRGGNPVAGRFSRFEDDRNRRDDRATGQNARRDQDRDRNRNQADNRRDNDRRAAERRDNERREAERRDNDRREAQRRDNERRDAQRRDNERREAQRRENDRREAQRRDNDRREAQRRDNERREAQRRENDRREAQRRDNNRREADRRRNDRDRYRDNRRDNRANVVFSSRIYVVNGRSYASRRGPAWRAPVNYRARAWRPGEYVLSTFLPVRIWDYQLFYLPAPGWNQHWIRIGNDALLIDARTGRIEAVIYNVFY